jgi:hypothetical protein
MEIHNLSSRCRAQGERELRESVRKGGGWKMRSGSEERA